MKIFSSTLLGLAVLILVGCGGGSSGGNANSDNSTPADSTMTLNITTQGTSTTTYSVPTSALSGRLVSYATYTQAIVEVTGPSLSVSVCASMSAGPGVYAVDSGLDCTGVQYVQLNDPVGTVQTYDSTSGTVTVTSFGGIGEPIVGTFDAVVSDTTDTMRVWGSFSVNRTL